MEGPVGLRKALHRDKGQSASWNAYERVCVCVFVFFGKLVFTVHIEKQ